MTRPPTRDRTKKAEVSPDNARVYQIYYDEKTFTKLDRGFRPLDNSKNERADWFEFWVIRRHLHTHSLDENTFYGFLSPKFTQKTGYTSTAVYRLLDQFGDRIDAAIFSTAWDQTAYFQNIFEQGEWWHPGLLAMSQRFFDHDGQGIDLTTLVTHSATSVLSNFVVARPCYWRQWLALADRFYHYVESGPGSTDMNKPTPYGAETLHLPMKAFVQERLAAIPLTFGGLRIIASDHSKVVPLNREMFGGGTRTQQLLEHCDAMKKQYCRTGERSYFAEYRRLRDAVPFLGNLPRRHI